VGGLAGAALFERMIERGAFVDASAAPGLVLGAGIAALVAVLKVITRPAYSAGAAIPAPKTSPGAALASTNAPGSSIVSNRAAPANPPTTTIA
jgi:hypothetical protein